MGDIVYTDLISDSTTHWGVSASTIEYGNTTLTSTLTEAILDTGTSLTILPQTIFDELLEEIDGGTGDCMYEMNGYNTCINCSSES